MLEDGTLNDVVKIAEEEWIGRFYSIPRDKAETFIKNDNSCSRWGIYLLLSNDCVYIGQSRNLKNRIKNHLLHKNWWETVVILTTNDDTFNKSDIDYLENKLIEKAKSYNTLDIDNIKKGNPAKVDEFRETTLDQYLEESLFLLEFVGVKVFTNKTKHTITNIVPRSTEGTKSLREKKEVFNYLEENGAEICKDSTYARLQENKNVFWMNPDIKLLKCDWTIILNNQLESEIYIFNIPKDVYNATYPKVNGKLVTRKDKRNKLELLIDATNFADRRTGLSFKKYLTKTYKY